MRVIRHPAVTGWITVHVVPQCDVFDAELGGDGMPGVDVRIGFDVCDCPGVFIMPYAQVPA